MFASELALSKRPNLVKQFLNVMPRFLTKHGVNRASFKLIALFLLSIKFFSLNSTTISIYNNSVYTRFYNFVNYYTPRVNLLALGGKTQKTFYVPLPPQKNNLLRTNFLLTCVKLAFSTYTLKNFPDRLLVLYKNTLRGVDLLSKSIDFTYKTAEQNKWRAEKVYMGKLKKQKQNVVKKNKQFYL